MYVCMYVCVYMYACMYTYVCERERGFVSIYLPHSNNISFSLHSTQNNIKKQQQQKHTHKNNNNKTTNNNNTQLHLTSPR